MKNKAIGEWIDFIELKEKGFGVTNQDLKHGEIVGIAPNLCTEYGLKLGDKVVVSTVKKMQDLIDSETHYFVNVSAIIRLL